MTRALRCSALAALIALATLLPYWNKAYTIDDPFFVHASAHVLEHPLHPTGLITSGRSWSWMRYLAMGYLLLPSAALGGTEWAIHVEVWLLLVAALVCLAALVLRLGGSSEQATIATLLVATSPAVLPMASTIMPEVPAMAFALFSVERIAGWRQERRWHQALMAVASLVIATLARPYLGLLLVVWAMLLGNQGLAWRTLWPVIAAAGVLAGVAGMALLHGVVGLDLHWGGTLASNLFALCVDWALTTPFVVGWLLLRPRLLRGGRLWLAILCAAGLLLVAGETSWLWLAPVAGLGAAVLADAVGPPFSPAGDELALKAWLLIPLPIVVYHHFAAKYLGAAMPAAAILLARDDGPRWRRRVVRWALPALGLSLSWLIIQADASWAGLYRAVAPTLVVENTWTDGSFGFAYYAERAGARSLNAGTAQPGDRVIRASIHSSMLEARYPDRVLLRSFEAPPAIGRVMSDGAGYYSNGWGYLPWAWGGGPLDRFEVWQIR